MKLIILVMCALILAGCGGDGNEIINNIPPKKTSVVDGSWYNATSTRNIYIDNGMVSQYDTLLSTLVSKFGTFSVYNNTLALTFTSSSSSAITGSYTFTGLTNPTPISESALYTFVVNGNNLSLTNSSGTTTLFTKY